MDERRRAPGPRNAPEPAAVTAPGGEPGLLASRLVYDGRIVRLVLDTVRFPDGSTGELEVVRHSGAAAVLPLLDEAAASDPRIRLLRQYRHAADGSLIEVPAGRPERPGEAWEACARRELEEEAGLVAERLAFLTTIYTTPGFTDERIHLFLAERVSPGQTARDDDEFIEFVDMPLSRALEWIRDGQIVDAKTICTLLYASRYILTRLR
ncbi:MAG: NUDIX hydrolase [Gemmatimonadetes bacterium]|nr:NUDIX hydrolase [Gemmatimonadota bacterium]